HELQLRLFQAAEDEERAVVAPFDLLEREAPRLGEPGQSGREADLGDAGLDRLGDCGGRHDDRDQRRKSTRDGCTTRAVAARAAWYAVCWSWSSTRVLGRSMSSTSDRLFFKSICCWSSPFFSVSTRS